MGDSRTKNTSRNILAGLWNRFSTILLSFVNRTITKTSHQSGTLIQKKNIMKKKPEDKLFRLFIVAN